MPHDTALATARLENLTFDLPISEEIANVSNPSETDTLTLLIEVPVNEVGVVPVDLPLHQTVTITIDDDQEIASVELVARQYTPTPATIAPNKLSATGSLPQVTHDECNTPEKVFLDKPEIRSDNDFGYYTVTNNAWTYVLDNPPEVPTGETRIDQFTVWSAGLAFMAPTFTSYQYVDPRDKKDPENLPSDWVYPSPNLVNNNDPDNPQVPVPLQFDPFLGRVPGSVPSLREEDRRLGLQLMLVDINNAFPGKKKCC